MNDTEFDAWYAYHRSLLPSMNTWLERLRKDQQIEIGDIIRQWRKQLIYVSLDEARAASLAIYEEQLPEPKPWDRLPLTIRRHSAAQRKELTYIKPVRHDGHDAVRCLRCRDYGRIVVWHPASIKAALDGREIGAPESRTKYTLAVACDCESGKPWVSERKKKPLVVFDSRLMLHVDRLLPVWAHVSAYEEYLRSLTSAESRPNYNQQLAEYATDDF